MKDWIRFADKKPTEDEMCDFLFTGDAVQPAPVIMCELTLDELNEYEDAAVPLYWRPAALLPDGVEYYYSDEDFAWMRDMLDGAQAGD